MQLLNEYHSFVGLQKDLNTLKHSPNFLYDARNIRLTAREDSTMYAITNEKGTEELRTLQGDFIGDCKLGKYLVVFTHSSDSDYIYRIDLSKDTPTVFLLYKGNINLDAEHPIEAIGNYETDSIQKVYWVDGKNPVRFINIEVKYKYDTLHSFDFVPPMKLEEEVEVYKSFGSGEFPSGVIQYAFTYFNENGHESNIFYTTPLQYISYKGRACSPEEKVANTFKLKISNIEGENFKYIRVYSILRTSINSTPIVKRVQDIEIPAAYKKEDSYWFGKSYYTLYNNLEVSIDGGYSFRNIDNLESFTLGISEVSKPSNAETITIEGTYYTPKGEENKVEKTISELWDEIFYAKGTKVYHFTSEQYPRLVVKTYDHYKSGDEIVKGDSYTIINSGKNTELYILHNNSLGILVVTCIDGKIDGKMVYCSLSDENNNNYKTVTCVDPGTIGDIIDPTELLYKGGEQLIASSITSLDNTLFLGNIKSTVTKPQIGNSYSNYSMSCILGERKYFIKNKNQDFSYIDILNSVDENTPYCGATCFKQDEYYRLGIQVQHESGKWSEPIYLTDHQYIYKEDNNNGTPYSVDTKGIIKVPEFEWKLKSNTQDTLVKKLITQGYKRIRPVFALSSGFEGRTIICQGVVCPTVYRMSDRYIGNDKDSVGNIYAQSSWLFRSSKTNSQAKDKGGKVSYENTNDLVSHYTEDTNPTLHMYNTEIMGIIEPFKVDCNFITLHSPDIIHDPNLYSIDYTGVTLHTLGCAEIKNTYGSIKMQTSSPPIGTSSSGDISKSIKTDGESALVSGLWYQDNIVDDLSATPTYGPLESSDGYKWLVSMWHKKGSFNNDVNREGRSAEISKKVISNYRLCTNTLYPYAKKNYSEIFVDIFNDDQVSLIKVGGKPYLGNIETMIYPTKSSPYYLSDSSKESLEYRLWSDTYTGLQKIQDGAWVDKNNKLGENVKNIVTWRDGISMKYKSTPHMVVMLDSKSILGSKITVDNTDISGLIVADVIKTYDTDTFFGGTSEDALKSNLWIPCGPPVNLKANEPIVLNYKWGDTYYGRYECLKTYPFTREDLNQVVEIASFTVESRVNIAGRYDRNRGQIDNTNMSPENFNLINEVYSQPDNFFSYRILDDSFYKEDKFPNQIIWSLVKTPGEEVDTWTSLSSASTYSLDGSKGEIVSLKTWKDSIYCFQDNGVSNILYNSRIQVPTSDGVPIEISNSNKLEGHRYITDGYGCVNKDNIKVCNSGIYFIDSTTNHLLYIGDGIKDISVSNGFSSWFNNNDINSIQYDPKHSDIYLVGENGALCFSETLGQFISIFDYDNIVSLSSYRDSVFSVRKNKLYRMFSGKYNEFFGDKKSWEFTFITNGLGQNQQTKDKIFSNIEYRIEEYNSNNELQDSAMTNLIVEDSYQSTGECTLTKSNTKSVVFNPKDSNIQKKKFKIWRIQIPRDSIRKLDRIRDTWCKITLSNDGNSDNKSILYDLNVQYYV